MVEGNREYSPKFCMFISNDLNSLFVNAYKGRYKCTHKKSGKYQAQFDGKSLGVFSTQQEAHTIYCIAKNNKIVDMANKYPKHANYILKRLYEVDI